ncbi:MAG: DNA polymerase III subunit delta [Bacilli bacterium]|nr:DNA polymerase III subunit delta [Bacilli bacterium]
MIYFIYGNQPPIIKKRINTIVTQVLGKDKDEMNFVKFNARDTIVQDVVSECNALPLGYDKKVVVLENAYFLLSKKDRVKIESDQDYQTLIDYINHPSEETTLIITVETNELDNKNKVYLALKEKADFLEASTPDKDSWIKFIGDYFTNHLKVKADYDAIREIAARCDGDILLFQNHAKKLALYTNHVTYNDVCMFVPRPLDDNVFAIYNYLITNRNDEAIKLYRDIIETGVEPVYLISTLAKQFRFLSQVSYLSKNGHSQDEIATMLGAKSTRIAIAKKQVYSVSESTVLKTLDDLFNLDYNIKSGLVDRFYAFELFLINFQAE